MRAHINIWTLLHAPPEYLLCSTANKTHANSGSKIINLCFWPCAPPTISSTQKFLQVFLITAAENAHILVYAEPVCGGLASEASSMERPLVWTYTFVTLTLLWNQFRWLRLQVNLAFVRGINISLVWTDICPLQQDSFGSGPYLQETNLQVPSEIEVSL